MSSDLSFLEIAHSVSVVKYTLVATITVITYDYFLTFEEERRLVWPSRFSMVKMIFFLIRYLPFFFTILEIYTFIFDSDGNNCKRAVLASVVLTVSLFIIGEMVLFMRAYAIWFCKRSMFVFLLVVYIPGAACAVFAAVRTAKSATAEFIPALFPHGCLVSFPNREFWIDYVVLLFHETLLVTLVLAKAFVYTPHSPSSLLRMMVKDGLFYYICVLSTSIMNLIVLLKTNSEICTFFIITQGVIHSILCQRLLLRLRGAYESLTEDGRHALRAQGATTLSSEDTFPMSVLGRASGK